MIAMIMSGGWLTALITLLVSSEKRFRNTFYQPTRAWEYNKALYDTGLDEYRMFIFDDHREYYRWYEGEVKMWLAEVWDDLHSKKPAWLTEKFIRNIPLDLIPNIESLKGEMTAEEVQDRQHRELARNSLKRASRTSLGVGDLSTNTSNVTTANII